MINRFVGPHRFLSNFYPAIIVLDDKHYPTVEHAYQAAKTTNLTNRERIRSCQTPGFAKKLGSELTLRPNWIEIKRPIMHDLVWQKFSRHEHLGHMLILTGSEELIEGNTWGDIYWGVCNGKGENHLGKILMKVREELKRNT